MPDSIRDADPILQGLQEIQSELGDIKRHLVSLNDAFPKNDLAKPDFDGHRQDHLRRMEEAKTLRDYKNGVTKQVVSLIVVFLVGLLCSGFVNTFAEKVTK